MSIKERFRQAERGSGTWKCGEVVQQKNDMWPRRKRATTGMHVDRLSVGVHWTNHSMLVMMLEPARFLLQEGATALTVPWIAGA